jgi:hypothetical protein
MMETQKRSNFLIPYRSKRRTAPHHTSFTARKAASRSKQNHLKNEPTAALQTRTTADGGGTPNRPKMNSTRTQP